MDIGQQHESDGFVLEELGVEELNLKGVDGMNNYGGGYTGYTYRQSAGYAYYQMWDGGWNFGSSQPVPPPEPDTNVEPPPLECSDTSQMSPEQLRDYKISEVAAAIAREIMKKPDRDINEYGAFILQDANGNIYMGVLYQGGPTSTPLSYAGIDVGNIVGYVHSHTASQWQEALPQFKLYPTPNAAGPGGYGDWAAFDAYSGDIYANLLADGRSREYADGRSMTFRQYILGPTGPVGSGSYQLRGYSFDNRDITSLGQLISLNLGLCAI
jgi:hypothetical protein